MKRFSFCLAMIAAIAMTVLPVAPSFAAQPVSKKAGYEMREGAAVLTIAQLEQVKTKRPKLHAKLVAAHKVGTKLHVSASDARYLLTMSKKTMDEVKGGAIEAVAIIAAALIVVPIVYKWVTGKDLPTGWNSVFCAIATLFLPGICGPTVEVKSIR